jgi:hypothetical protein
LNTVWSLSPFRSACLSESSDGQVPKAGKQDLQLDRAIDKIQEEPLSTEGRQVLVAHPVAGPPALASR